VTAPAVPRATAPAPRDAMIAPTPGEDTQAPRLIVASRTSGRNAARRLHRLDPPQVSIVLYFLRPVG
jgi:hypothetical protein